MGLFLTLSEQCYPQTFPTYPLANHRGQRLNTKVKVRCKSRANCKAETLREDNRLSLRLNSNSEGVARRGASKGRWRVSARGSIVALAPNGRTSPGSRGGGRARVVCARPPTERQGSCRRQLGADRGARAPRTPR